MDEARVHILVNANGTILSGVEVVHLLVECRRGTPRPPAAFGIQDDADARGIAQGAVFHFRARPGIEIQELFDQVFADLALGVHFFD